MVLHRPASRQTGFAGFQPDKAAFGMAWRTAFCFSRRNSDNPTPKFSGFANFLSDKV